MALKAVQVNLHHAQSATDVLCRRFTKEKLTVALIQEPWVNKTRILGIQLNSCKLVYDDSQLSPRAAILIRNNTKCFPITEFIKKDIVAVRMEVPTARGKSEILMVSAYFPGDAENIPPPEIAAIVHYSRIHNIPFVIGCDANAHHTVWGSTDINTRGEYLLQFLSSKNINICNVGDKPTFSNSIRQEVLDLTLCSPSISDKIKNWHVSDETSMSDHKHIIFDWEGGLTIERTFKDPKKTDWETYSAILQSESYIIENNIKSIMQLESASACIKNKILNAYQESCPTRTTSSSRDVPWWNKTLDKLRKTARREFNRAKRTSDWSLYKKALTDYNKELRRSKRKSWVSM